MVSKNPPGSLSSLIHIKHNGETHFARESIVTVIRTMLHQDTILNTTSAATKRTAPLVTEASTRRRNTRHLHCGSTKRVAGGGVMRRVNRLSSAGVWYTLRNSNLRKQQFLSRLDRGETGEQKKHPERYHFTTSSPGNDTLLLSPIVSFEEISPLSIMKLEEQPNSSTMVGEGSLKCSNSLSSPLTSSEFSFASSCSTTMDEVEEECCITTILLSPKLQNISLQDTTNDTTNAEEDVTMVMEEEQKEVELKNLLLSEEDVEEFQLDEEETDFRLSLVKYRLPNVIAFGEYFEENHQYYKHLETTRSINDPEFINTQIGAMTCRIRCSLIDWLSEVVDEFSCRIETYFTTVNLMDRYLSIVKDTQRNKLQLVGVACLFIMAKIHGICPISKKAATEISADAYSEDDLLEMEAHVARTVDYQLTSEVVPYHFLDLYSNYMVLHGRTLAEQSLLIGEYKYLINYMLEITLLDPTWSFDIKPSVIASAAILLSRVILKHNNPQGDSITKCTPQVKYLWPPLLEKCTGYTQESLCELAVRLHSLVRQYIKPGGTETGIQIKYTKARYCNVTRFSLPDEADLRYKLIQK